MPSSVATHVAILVVFVFASCAGKDIVLKPVSPGKMNAALIIVQGPGIATEPYVPLAQSIQAALSSANVSLWIGIPQYDVDIPVSMDLGKGIDRIASGMEKAGMPSSAAIFIAAHSLSGIETQSYVFKNPKSVSGQILLGSFLQRKYRNETYPVSTLTVSGELDGVCRVSRVMEEYWHRISAAKKFLNAVTTFPVVVVPGMSHFQFLASNDNPPIIVKELDLKSEISFADAHKAVSASVGAFIEAYLGSQTAAAILAGFVNDTAAFLQPLIWAYEMAGSSQLLPPCNENPPSPACIPSCLWTEKAVVMVGNLTSSQGTVSAVDSFHPASEIMPHIHHPQIAGTCTAPGSACVVKVTSVSQNIYSEADRLDTGMSYTSASEIRGKMKSRQSIMEATGMGPVNFNVSDAPDICMLLNQQAYSSSLAKAGQKTLQRYRSHGVYMEMGKTEGPYNNGGIWIYKPMSYASVKNSTGGSVLEVQSLVLKTDVDYFLKGFAGMHFCKLLSPARVMEWIYVDSLRTYYSFK